MNNTKRYDHLEMEKRVELAHQRAAGRSLGDVKLTLLIKNNAWLLTELMNKVLEPYGLNSVAYVALMSLHSTPHNLANPSEICQATGETRSNMTRITDELVASKWIRRVPNEEDRRRVDLSLTEEGIALLQVVVPLIRSQNESVFSIFSPEMKALFEKELFKLNQAIQERL